MARLPIDTEHTRPVTGGVAPGSTWLPGVSADTGVAKEFTKLSAHGDALLTSAGRVLAQQQRIKNKLDTMQFNTDSVLAFTNVRAEASQADPFDTPGNIMKGLDSVVEGLVDRAPDNIKPMAKAIAGEMAAQTYGHIIRDNNNRIAQNTVGQMKQSIDTMSRAAVNMSDDEIDRAIEHYSDPQGMFGAQFPNVDGNTKAVLQAQAISKMRYAKAMNFVTKSGLSPSEVWKRAEDIHDPMYDGMDARSRQEIRARAEKSWHEYQQKNAADLSEMSKGWETSTLTQDTKFGDELMARVNALAADRSISPAIAEKYRAVAFAAQTGCSKKSDGETWGELKKRVFAEENPLTTQELVKGWNDKRWPGLTQQEWGNLYDRVHERDNGVVKAAEHIEDRLLKQFDNAFGPTGGKYFRMVWQAYKNDHPDVVSKWTVEEMQKEMMRQAQPFYSVTKNTYGQGIQGYLKVGQPKSPEAKGWFDNWLGKGK